nr:glycosyltransferase [Acidimicrobiia bacterium]
MRVLTIIDSLAVGGAEQSLAGLTPHLTASGVEVHVAYLVERSGVGPELEAAGAVLHSLVGTGGRFGWLRRTRALIRKLRPDLVHTTLFEADIIGRTAAWSLRVPVVSSIVTEAYGPEHVDNPEYRAWKVRAAQAADAVTARMVRRFHAVSSSSAEVMAKRLRIPPGKIDVIPRGRDVAKLGERTPERRARVRASLGLTEDEPMVLAAARHFHSKGLDVLACAFPAVVDRFPSARLIIAGRNGPATPDIERIVQDGGVAEATEFLGYRNDVPDLMCAADVFALPSRVEGSPGALIEAMALCVPAVASDIPSVRELVGP